VIPTLQQYIQTYIPKYICTFSHPLTKVKSGSFYIGIDDDGIIHGIPFKGIITQEFIQSEILKVLSDVRGANGYDCLKEYIDKIKIDVTQLDKTNYITATKLNDLDINFSTKMYIELINSEKKEKKLYKEYIKKKRDWEKFYNSIPQKTNDILNDKKIRKQIIDLLKKEVGTSIVKYEPKYKNIYGWCEIKHDYWNMIVELKSDKEYEPITFEKAEKIRNNRLSAMYWGLKWRDLKTIPSKYLKPRQYRQKHNYKHYSLLLASQIPKMIPSWIKKNPDLNLHVIKITFSGNISSELFLEYKDNSTSNQWIRSYRTIVDDEPRCQPIY
jgi:hypothetical protein